MTKANITFEYAQNFEENEQKWIRYTEDLRLICCMFSKDTASQLVLGHDYEDVLNILGYLQEGERGKFLEDKIKIITAKYEKGLEEERKHYKEVL